MKLFEETTDVICRGNAGDCFGFFAFGVPRPAGSHSSYVPMDKRTGQPCFRNGRVVVSTVDANKQTKPWQSIVLHAARQAWGDNPPSDLPCFASYLFRFNRPKAHYRANGDLKPNAPTIVASGGYDLDKLIRAVNDSLTGIVYRDDRQIIGLGETWRVYANPPDEPIGCDVTLRFLPLNYKPKMRD